MTRAVVRAARVAAFVILALLAFAGRASSQTPPGNIWSHGTTLELFGGAAHTMPNTQTGTFGTAVGWEVNHLAEIEGMAAWFAERSGAQSFAADLKLLLNLTRPAPVVPYLGAGAGLYRASFDAPNASLPSFYTQRLPVSSSRVRATFTDPTIVVAGGANFFAAGHLSMRPELGVRLVMNGSDVHSVTTFTIALIYHVEDHSNVR